MDGLTWAPAFYPGVLSFFFLSFFHFMQLFRTELSFDFSQPQRSTSSTVTKATYDVACLQSYPGKKPRMMIGIRMCNVFHGSRG